MPQTLAIGSLVIGTGNRHKAAELAELLAPLNLSWQSLADLPTALEVAETGATFAENAVLKATLQAVHLKRWVLADDSGLAVDALDGRPGVYSARYAGPEASDDMNNDKLLIEVANVPDEKRTAHYVCHLALADPSGKVVAQSTGYCHGRIRRAIAGSGGFGYDPLFEVIEYKRTFGELSPAVKSILSHRARAAYALLPTLAALK